MGFIRWLIGFCIALAIAMFTATNRAEVTVIWSPFHAPQTYPLFFPLIIFLTIGFILGAFSVWLNSYKTRRARRCLAKRVKALEKRVENPDPPQTLPALPDLAKKS